MLLKSGVPIGPWLDSLRHGLLENLLIKALQEEGFWKAQWLTGPTCQTLRPGEQFSWVQIGTGNVPEEILRAERLGEHIFKGQPFRHKDLMGLYGNILGFSENHGYPFAVIRLDSIHVDKEVIHGQLHLDPGPYITFDTLKIAGTSRVSPEFLGLYLGVRPGEPYQERAVAAISERIEGLPYLRLNGEITIHFQNEMATVHVPLRYVPSNAIDGIIGFFPNQSADGGLLLTGQVDLDLNNLFSSGKHLSFFWQRQRPQSQVLDIRYRHPFLLKTPIHFDGHFNLFKEDTTFLNRDFRAALEYDLDRYRTISVFSNHRAGRILGVPLSGELERLPEVSDFNVSYYGVGYTWNRLRPLRNPARGFSLISRIAAGNKRILRNANIPEELLEGVALNTAQYTADLSFLYFQPLGRQLRLFHKLSGGWVTNERLFFNDMYRLGGINNLRGFNENEFFASEWVLSNLELRLYFEETSYLIVLYDQAYLSYDTGLSTFNDAPSGLGVGLALQAGNGLLNIIYALGRTADQSFSFNLSKIHFGYMAKF